MTSPPLLVRSPSPWLRAGYLAQECITATALLGEELEAAFHEDPAACRPLPSAAGAAFDPRTGSLFAPDGSSLVLETASDWLGVTPRRLRLRCRSAGLDWSVLVSRIDRRPSGTWDYRQQTMSRWSIDHDQFRQAWRREGHDGLPDPDAWDRLRQFVEEAVLSWGDGPAAGPAPQSLATSGGWYEGKWRGGEFRRLLARPIDTDRGSRTDKWQPYVAGREWRRTDDIPATRQDPISSGYASAGAGAPFVPFEKVALGPAPARLFASGFILTHSRDEARRTDLVDYCDESDHVRLAGLRTVLCTASLVRAGAPMPQIDENGRVKHPPYEAIEAPGLSLWRRLRDAGEGGLREGEIGQVAGGYVFDRFYGDALRITALGAEIEDFDYRMFATGGGL
jgi:hypothetical protein